MNTAILTLDVRLERDMVLARQRARQIADLLGFDAREQICIATAVLEITRNAIYHGGGGKVEFLVEGKAPPQMFLVRIRDQGPGIKDLPAILEGQVTWKPGSGRGIIGARKLMDRFEIESSSGQGTLVLLGKTFPKMAPVVTERDLARISDELGRRSVQSSLEEVQRQNQELLWVLGELRKRQEELTRMSHELEETNRGVVALYTELDEKVEHLKSIGDLKSRFFSSMSHELRTPLNSMLALSQLLLDRTDGELTEEQEKQVTFLRKAAEDLSELVNDLLDLARIEAGKVVVRPKEFQVSGLFSALRGLFRPFLTRSSVALIFEEPVGVPQLYTDEGKVSQILSNFISNALKFTERGEIRVSATVDLEGKGVVLSVADTGIGIPPEDQGLIFQEFTQLENPLQKQIKGAGLGLPLSKKLAELIGGHISVKSAPGVGSTFSVVVPLHNPAYPYNHPYYKGPRGEGVPSSRHESAGHSF